MSAAGDQPNAAKRGTDVITAKPIRISRGTSGHTRLTAMIVACALFMQNLDSTVIATALPTMARAFGADPVHMNVALTSYLLSLAVFIPASGWMADRFGTRTVFRAAIIVFTLGSVACGQANSLGVLVLARILQGIGGAMMVPVGRLVLLRTVPKHELVAAMAWLTMPALLGPVVGPPVGGFIVTYASWRWIFYINVPICLLGITLVSLFVEDVREPPRGKFDAIGLVLSGLALSGLMFGLETAGRGVVSSHATETMVAIGLASAFTYWLHARRHPAPLLDLSLLRLPCFGVAISAMILFRAGIGAIPFLLPMMLQVGFGDSAAQSGLITFASSAGALVMKPAAQHALRQFGFRDTLLWNGIISGVMIAMCALFRPTWPAAAIYLILLTGGFFRSLQFTAYNTLAYGDVPRPRMSAATSLYTAVQQLATTVGISVGALSLHVSMLVSRHTAPTPADFSLAFVVVGLLTTMAAPIALGMPRNAGDDLTGRRSA
ncbi:MAG TPA: DHA2 family efflux MFS transporter permease subunit [Acetobacteraceae bacterium]|nr:DHA2 family efflux MFS transporter permease subunit [Acetobacteraceae bacterium]